MESLFGVSMNAIALVCVIITSAILLVLAYVAIRNPVMFKMGIRNIPRRPAQTTLIILGLMLSTVIITAAFGTGDTMTHSVTAEIYNILGETDELVEYDRERFPVPEDQQVLPLSLVDDLKAHFAGDEDIDAFLGLRLERLPVFNTRTRLNEPVTTVVAYRAAEAEPFGGLNDIDGEPVSLSGNQIAVNEALASEIQAEVGDSLWLFFGGQPVEVVVAAIVPNTFLGGSLGSIDREGATLSFEFMGELTGRPDIVNFIAVSNVGGVRDGVKLSDSVVPRLEAALEGTPFKVEPLKQDALEEAELIGNFFTSFFVVFGLFSIAAGVLLIFLIFVMLAAERKPEMGMARAVGAKRRQIVESFLAEGMGYDLGSALVGIFVGIGVVFVMIAFITSAVGDELGLVIDIHITPRSLVISFCLGVIATFIVIFLASWRASRINITAAIRDLPESQAVNPERSTWMGYLRGVLNGFASFGVITISLILAMRFSGLWPLFLLGALSAIAGPWISLVRHSNFGASSDDRKVGEGPPNWPWILGLVLLPAFGIGLVILVGYGLALLLVRVTRDRRPNSVPLWLLFLGIVIAPLGQLLSALQDRGRSIAWSVGFGTVGAVTGVLLIEWGLDANRIFQFALGVSLILLWIALTLRHFRAHERASFTLVSLALLVFWYMPSSVYEGITGELRGDFEMFFLSGAAMITAGTFIVIYNADILLPAISRMGSRFGRVFPAIKTAVAYPLTARFRTGMTVAMIGLIMFSLVMFQTINANFVELFLGDAARGGFDGQAVVNVNNPIDDFEAAVEAGGGDSSQIELVAATRVAYPFENEIKDPNPKEDDRGELKEYGTFIVRGLDEMFLQTTTIGFQRKAAGFGSDQEIWDALRSDGSLAVVSSLIYGTEGFGEDPALSELIDLGDKPADGFEPFELTLRTPGTDQETVVRVIGVMEDRADTFFMGVMLRADTFQEVLPAARGQTFYFNVVGGADAEEVARDVEAALLQASVDSLGALLDDFSRQNRGFLYLFQGFMGLGLLVGIAALGVIASRSVVERRQQIGMLRAIGYRRSMVAMSFLFESSFIALSGILMGFVLAVSLSWVLFTTGEIDESAEGANFFVPWLELGAICAIGFIASMVMTVLPARGASRVPVAEALRFE